MFSLQKMAEYYVYSNHFGHSSVQPNIEKTLIGEKAYGLLKYIEEETLPFIIIKSNLYDEWCKDKLHAKKILLSISKDIFSLFDSLNINNFIIRSSAKIETYKERGNYFSSDGNISKDNLYNEIIQIWEKNQEACSEFDNNSFSVIIQQYKESKLVGHISNERRISRNYDDWLIEYYDAKGRYKNSERVKQTKEETLNINLNCKNIPELKKVLKSVPTYVFSKMEKKRLHIEWVWDKSKLYLVQCDVEGDLSETSEPGSDWRISNLKEGKNDLKMEILNPASASSFGKWPKTNCVQTFAALNLPCGEIYILDDTNVIEQLRDGIIPKNLKKDLKQLLKCPIVIRTDIAEEEEHKRVLLPRTDTIFKLDDAINYLLKNVIQFLNSDIPIGNFCFLIHRFILSRSCALVLTKPNRPNKARIDSTWGIVDGLYYHPHDSFEVTVQDGKLITDMKHIRCKNEYLDVRSDGKWFSKKSGNYDWKESLTKKERLTIAQYTVKIANYLKKSVVVMYFVDVNKSTGYDKIIPWFYTTDEVTENSERFSDSIFSNNYILIETKEDISKLHIENWDLSLKYTLKLKPDDEIIRDKKIVEEIAHFSKENNIPVELEGSILAHPYYILKKNGVRVKCVDYFEPQYKSQSFNKLVRDKIPLNIESKGEKTTTLEIEPKERLLFLKKKAIEEALEFYWESTDKAIIEELADLYEIIRSSCSVFNIDIENIKEIADNKAQSKGGFDTGVFLLDTKDSALIDTIEVKAEEEKSSLFKSEMIEKKANKLIPKKNQNIYFDNSILHIPYISDPLSIKLPSSIAENKTIEINYKNREILIRFLQERAKEDLSQYKIEFPED